MKSLPSQPTTLGCKQLSEKSGTSGRPACTVDLGSMKEEVAGAVEPVSPTGTPPKQGVFPSHTAQNAVFRFFSNLLTLTSPVVPEGLPELDDQTYGTLSLSVPLFPPPKKVVTTIPPR